MINDVWKRSEVESPCVKLCVVHSEHKICLGCFRTVTEITKWSHFSKQKRKEIMQTLHERSKILTPKRRGSRNKPLNS